MGKGEIRKTSRERHATSTSLVTKDGTVFRNEAFDNVKRKTELRFLPPPIRLATNRVTVGFEHRPMPRGHSLLRFYSGKGTSHGSIPLNLPPGHGASLFLNPTQKQ